MKKDTNNKPENKEKQTMPRSGPLTREEMHQLEKSISEEMRPFELEAIEKENNSWLKSFEHFIG